MMNVLHSNIRAMVGGAAGRLLQAAWKLIATRSLIDSNFANVWKMSKRGSEGTGGGA